MTEIAGPEPSRCLRGEDDIAQLYTEHAIRVRRLVALNVTAPAAVVDDACQVAWMRLVVHRERVRRPTAIRWLVRVASHEALHAAQRGERDVPFDAELETDERVPTPPLLEELSERRERLRGIGALSRRQRRIVWLRGLGFSYAEISGQTGDSLRTVERQLQRAVRRLAEEAAA